MGFPSDRRSLVPFSAFQRRLVTLVFIVAIGARVIPVYRPLDQRLTAEWREADYAQLARNFDREGLNIFFPRIDWRGDTPGFVEMEFPLLPWAGGLLYRVVGPHVQTMRVLVSVVSVAGLWVFWRLCCSLLPPSGAIYALAAFALNPTLIELSTALQPDALMIVLSLCSVYLAVAVWREAPSTGVLVAAGALTGAAILAKAPAACVGVVIAYVVLERRGWSALREPGVLAAAAVAIVPPLAWYAWARHFWYGYGNSLGLSNETHLIGLDMLWPPNFLFGILKLETLKVVTPLGWILVLAAALGRARRGRLALVWYGGVWLLYLIAARTTGDDWAYYYHAIAAPPVCLLIGAGVDALLPEVGGQGGLRPFRRQTVLGHGLGIATLLTLGAFGVHQLHRQQAKWRGPLAGMYTCAVELKERVPPDGRIVVSGGTMFDEYGKPVAYNMPMLFAWMDRRGFNYGAEELSFATLDRIADRGGRYWVATRGEIERIGEKDAVDRRYQRIADCTRGYSLFDLKTAAGTRAPSPSR